MVKLDIKEDFYSKNEYEVLNSLDSSKSGLSDEEIILRQRIYGKNIIHKKNFKGFLIFIRQFKSPLIWVLILSALISMILKETASSLIIIIIVVLSAFLSFINEYRSDKIVENLNKKITHKCIVLRNGKKNEIFISELVPGDIVYLNIGSVVPADLRLIETRNLEINESILTGESVSAFKSSKSLTSNVKNLSDLKNISFMGTIVTGGEGVGVVIRTGVHTEIGKISEKTIKEKPESEFEKGLRNFGGLLLKIILSLTIIIFFINALIRKDFWNSLLFALAIAVGITPELLPAILSVSLSRGAMQMGKKDVIVRRLISIEDFGNMDILCSDKTGTLTEGNISLVEHVDFENNSNEDVFLYGLLCNSTVIHGKKFIGNPIDIAIYKHSKEKDREKLMNYEKIDELPFDYERKRMSVIVKREDKTLIITKGAPYKILNICKKVKFKSGERLMRFYSKKIEERYKELANDGFRVIAVAYKEINNKKKYDFKDESGLTFFGFITFLDPPKKTVKESIDKLQALGIKFKILTGDNEFVTRKVAEQVDLQLKKIVLGDEIDKLNDYQLSKVVEETDAFCRLTPFQKSRIILILKRNGHEVGYIGDGVNDVLALHEADVGISVNDSVDVAKEASDIILMKKSISVLVEGVIEGRKIFNNTTKYILLTSSSNFGNMFSVAGSSLFLKFLPMLPVQILLLNFLSDFSQFTIPVDNVDNESLKKPKKLNIKVINKYMLIFGPISSIYDFLTYFVMLFIFSANASLFQTGWFIESMMTEIFVIFSIRTRRFPFFKSKAGKWLIISTIIVTIITLVIPFVSPIRELFGFTKPPFLYFFILIVMVFTYILLVDVIKYFFFKKNEL
ncbi:MAG: magnesium-translocating P-type ATPase [Candidatus Pacearchaeota archaeon]